MLPVHRRYLVVEQGIGAAVVNFVLNAVIGWLLFRHQDIVPLWGQQGIASDTIGTTFFLPLLTCVIVTRVVRRHLRGGRVPELVWTPASHPLLGWLPASTLRRGLVLGALCTAVVAPVTVLILVGLDVDTLSLWRFVMFKGTFAAVLAAIVTPVIALWALAPGR